jgi:aspartyl-tRNA(Asn)/glutamyl-tRNA(Gln) amidotransferase subunit A
VPGAVEIAARVRRGELDPVHVIERTLEKIEQRSELNAFITVSGDRALSRARAGVEGPLAGLPLLVKDVIDTGGVRTTSGSRIYAHRVPSSSAPTVLALEAAGAIVVGKTNCDEFAWGVTGQNPFYGDVQNPVLPGRIAGGSSAGNAAALAAGLGALALGTDTGGSVRMPAGCCQIVGLKPGLGTVSTAGVFPLCPSFDTVGPMARTVEDCVRCIEVLTGRPVARHGVTGLRVGVLTAMPSLSPAIATERDERTLALAPRLEQLGMRVQEVALPVPEADLWPVFYAEAAATHRDTFPARRDEYGPIVAAKLEAAQQIDPSAVSAGRAALRSWRELALVEPPVDAFVSPTLGVHEIPPNDANELEVRIAFSGYTRVFSFLGWPAMAIGGLQFAARDENVLLAVALAWEAGSTLETG